MVTASVWCRHARSLGLVALATLLGGTATALARERPSAAAPEVISYRHQSDSCGAAALAKVRSLYETDTVIDEADPASANAWFSPDLAADLVRLYSRPESLGIGFGYLVDGQDSELSAITFASCEAGTDDRPGVRVRFTNFGEPVDLDFILDNDGRIANIRSLSPDGTEKWNLRDTVAEALREPVP
jgi:hypothetical protein